MFWREPTGAMFTFAFPMFFLTIFAELFNRDRPTMERFTPTMVAFGIITACFTNLVVTITSRRETGVFKRKRSTPLSITALLGGMIGSVIAVALVLTTVLVALGALAYGVTPSVKIIPLVVVVGLGSACFCALGVAVANFTPSVEAAPALAQGVLYPIAFISDTFLTVPSDSILRTIAAVFPVRHFNDAMVAAYGDGSFAWRHYAVLGAWTAGGVVVGARMFRWTPRSA
jgi:ABC-2 type transport system permease protein